MNHHMDKATEERLRAEAWVGDAILALYVREWILAEDQRQAFRRIHQQ